MNSECSVHGRFQVFHNDHARYLKEAFSKYDYVFVGLTGCASLTSSVSDVGRLSPSKNPLCYWERVAMISAFLREAEIGPARYQFVPFPIERPELLEYYVPKNSVCVTTIREDWNAKKVGILRALGYEVVVLYDDRNKCISSTQVRDLIAQADPAWKKLVPLSIADYLETNQLTDRIAFKARDINPSV